MCIACPAGLSLDLLLQINSQRVFQRYPTVSIDQLTWLRCQAGEDFRTIVLPRLG